MVAVLTWFPSMTGSFTPVTVTTCGVSQSALVKVSAVGEITASPLSDATMSRITSSTG